MDLPEGSAAWICHCGRSFVQQPALNYHKRTCQPSKKRLQGCLAKAKDLWLSRKKRHLDPAALALGPPEGSSDHVLALLNDADNGHQTGVAVTAEVRHRPGLYPPSI